MIVQTLYFLLKQFCQLIHIFGFRFVNDRPSFTTVSAVEMEESFDLILKAFLQPIPQVRIIQ